jgi:two-component system cell cycle response regulator
MHLPRILIVHRSKTIHRVFELALGGIRLEVDIISSEAEIWPLVEQHAYRIVLMSRQSISEDLKGFVKQIRAVKGYEAIPLIMLVNSESSRHNKALYQSGITRAFSMEKFPVLVNYIEQGINRTDADYALDQKIILIEDGITQQKIFRNILSKIACEVICFTSAEDALKEAEKISPRLIICDCFLEGDMTALEFVPIARSVGHPWFTVPILAMSGFDDMTRRHELIRSGDNDFIAKPIDAEDLLVRVENLLRYKYLLEKVEQQSQVMKELAMRDALTGLYNRHFLAERIPQTIASAHRHKIDVAMIMIDIDFFKKINDQHGHSAGDKVLTAVATLLSTYSRGEDIVARIGGEEFIILLSHCSMTQAREKAEALRQSIETLNPESLNITASFGVAQLSDHADDYDHMFKAADTAVYQAKNSGRNQVAIAPSAIH